MLRILFAVAISYLLVAIPASAEELTCLSLDAVTAKIAQQGWHYQIVDGFKSPGVAKAVEIYNGMPGTQAPHDADALVVADLPGGEVIIFIAKFGQTCWTMRVPVDRAGPLRRFLLGETT